MPQKVAGSARMHDQRIAEILVVHDHQQVDEHGGEQEPDAEIAEGVVHALDLADHLDGVARLQLLLQVGHDLVDLAGDAAEIAALHAGIDLVDRLDVGLVGVGRHAVALERRDVAEQAGHRPAAAPTAAVETGVLPRSFSERDLALGRLHREIVGNARCRIGPEIGRHLLRRAQADIDVVGDGVGIEAELRRARAVDRGVEGRRVDFLLEMGVDDAGNGGDAPAQLLGDAAGCWRGRSRRCARRSAPAGRSSGSGSRCRPPGNRTRPPGRPPAAPGAACARSRRSAHGLPSAPPGSRRH